jgi:hypothetical protein
MLQEFHSPLTQVHKLSLPLSRDKIILLKKEENYLEKDILVRIGQANKDIIGDSEKSNFHKRQGFTEYKSHLIVPHTNQKVVLLFCGLV